jgi:3-hydroxyisobutyrate dehydrogenase-like beta-hydroxyacid dehydrogenase
MTRVGVVGLGAMGAGMAMSLARAGFELTLYDVRPGRADELGLPGARSASSAREAAEGVDALVVMVVNAAQAREVLLSPEGAGSAMAPGSAAVLMSTIGPEPARELASELAERGVALVDAPVSGGAARAESGDLLIMVGTPPEVFERFRPVLDAMGSTVAHCGPVAGDGQGVKLVNQLLAGVHIAAAAEALAYAEALGLDPGAVREVVRHGAAGSFMLEDRGQRMVEGAWSPPKSALNIFVKDMGLVVDAGRARSADMPLAAAAQELYERGAGMGLGDEDDSGVIRVLRARRAE